jgi:hypothetical protein
VKRNGAMADRHVSGKLPYYFDRRNFAVNGNAVRRYIPGLYVKTKGRSLRIKRNFGTECRFQRACNRDSENQGPPANEIN